jgi:signal transduction histidine kinase
VGVRLIEDPQVVALAILVLTVVLLAMASVITRSFERLAEAAKLKTEFVSIVSHQLRAPLSNMKWIADILVSGKGNNHQGDYFTMLKENAGRMQELVNDLLMVSRIEEGGLAPQKKDISLQGLVDDVVRNFAPVMKAANITLEVKGDGSLPAVSADEMQVRNAVSNLLDNAIQYTGKTNGAVLHEPGKKRSITIRYGKEGNKARFEIEDTGVGIPVEDQRHIFQKFFRSSNVMRHETQGSGLGLYIAKSIVERSGGKMGFVSKEHKGSTFWFTIPLSKI